MTATDFMVGSANHNTMATNAREKRPAAEHANAEEAAAPGEGPIRHIYVHIPFCARICPYCAFYKTLPDRSLARPFCEAILRELDQRRRTCEVVPETIYFGGGTPTALGTVHLEFLLRGIRQRIDLSNLSEWTLEANPGSVSAHKASALHKLGITRISLGVQSWDNGLLKLLGREHTPEQARKSFQLLRAAGFSNINIDLMFGLPGQTIDQWKATLTETIALAPEHISAYCLTYEEDTEFFLRFQRAEFSQDPDADAEFFETAMITLEAAGYEQYEISNYARPGFRSAHNRAYWLGKDYLGIGPSAVSTVGLRRWQNVADYRAYIERLLTGESPAASTEDLTAQMKRTERIALLLRTSEGVPAQVLKPFASQTTEFIALGLLRESNGNFVLTRKGRQLADLVAEAFL